MILKHLPSPRNPGVSDWLKRDYSNYTDRICLFDGIETRRKLILFDRKGWFSRTFFPQTMCNYIYQTKTLEGHLQWTKTCKARWNPFEITRFLKRLLSIWRPCWADHLKKPMWRISQSNVVHHLPPKKKQKNKYGKKHLSQHLPIGSMYGILYLYIH